MQAYLRFVERRPRAILAVLALVTLFFGLQLRHTSFDNNPYLLPETHPARKSLLDLQKEFGGTYDAVQIALHDPQGVFNRATLDAVYDLTQAAQRLMLATPEDGDQLRALAREHGTRHPELAALVDGMLADGLDRNDSLAAVRLEAIGRQLHLPAAERSFLAFLPHRLSPLKATASLAASDNIITVDGTLNVTKSLRDKTTDPALIRAQVVGNDLLRGLVSKGERVTQVVVELALKQDDADGQLRAYEAVERLVADYRRSHPDFHGDIHIAGAAVSIAEAKRLTDRDLGTLFPVVVAVIGAILIAYFRRPLGFLLPMLNVVACTVWTLGAMALLRVPLDTITSMLPVFLITICGADAIHLMNEYYEQESRHASVRPAVRATVRTMFSPVVLTTLTTVAGFLFATATNISSIRAFGLFMVVGLLSAQAISLLLIPAWLNLTSTPQKAGAGPAVHVPAAHRPSLLARGLGRLLDASLEAVIRHRRRALWGFVALVAACGWLAAHIEVEDEGSRYFREDNAFRRADEFINAHVSGTSPGWLRIQNARSPKVLDQDTVEFIERLDNFLRQQPDVSYTYSLASYLRRMNLALHDMDPAHDRLPRAAETIDGHVVSGQALMSELILLYENGGGDELNYVLKRDGSAAATLFAMNTTKASDYKRFLARLDAWLQANKPPHLRVGVAGVPVIWSGVLDEILSGQFASIVLALASVCGVLMLWQRSLREGLLATLPLAATIVVYYGLMAAAGIELNIGTALISFVVVGIVDYSVHYLHRIKAGLEEGMALDAALRHALRHAGRSIAFNVAVFSAGFLVLLLSDYQPIAYLGGLVALALLISGAMSLFLISLLAPVGVRRPAPSMQQACGK